MKTRNELNKNLAQMLKGGVIMDVTNVSQAQIAEEAGAAAVMALERVPADIRREGGVARMSDPKMIREIKAAVSIPVMAKVRIGHFVEAQILEAIGIDYIDESEVLTPADPLHPVNKAKFRIPFVCGARNLGEALRIGKYNFPDPSVAIDLEILSERADVGSVIEEVTEEWMRDQIDKLKGQAVIARNLGLVAVGSTIAWAMQSVFSVVTEVSNGSVGM